MPQTKKKSSGKAPNTHKQQKKSSKSDLVLPVGKVKPKPDGAHNVGGGGSSRAKSPPRSGSASGQVPVASKATVAAPTESDSEVKESSKKTAPDGARSCSSCEYTEGNEDGVEVVFPFQAGEAICYRCGKDNSDICTECNSDHADGGGGNNCDECGKHGCHACDGPIQCCLCLEDLCDECGEFRPVPGSPYPHCTRDGCMSHLRHTSPARSEDSESDSGCCRFCDSSLSDDPPPTPIKKCAICKCPICYPCYFEPTEEEMCSGRFCEKCSTSKDTYHNKGPLICEECGEDGKVCPKCGEEVW